MEVGIYLVFTHIYLWGQRRQWHPTPVLLPENPMGGGAWWAAVHGVAKSQTWLSDCTFTFMHWRRKWQPTPVFLPGESQGWGSLMGCRLWVAQSRTRLKRLSSSSSIYGEGYNDLMYLEPPVCISCSPIATLGTLLSTCWNMYDFFSRFGRYNRITTIAYMHVWSVMSNSLWPHGL